jgi:serine phosphatase RsbU (regulator of sigma subunit)
VARLCVPEVADWCGLYVREEDGSETEITSGHEDAELEAFLRNIRRRRREREGASESRQVAESGQAVLATDVRGVVTEEVSESEKPLMDRLAAQSYMLVPLQARGRSIGSLTLLSTREDRHYTQADLDFAQDLAGRCALAIDNARLHGAERTARLRADFLARAGALLDESLDYEQTLRAVAGIAVPEVADWCTLSILDPGGILQQVAAAHVDPEQRALGEELNRRWPPDPRTETGGYRVARTGETMFAPEITDDMLVAAISDPDQLALVRRLALRSVVIAPLRARGRIMGTLTLANAEASRPFGDADIQLAEELGRRAGLAIDNARLYTERTRIAHTLQVKLLPERLPEIPGARVAARYRAAGELNEVGGDFYDLFARGDGEWALVVGDVTGKGAEAAAVTALARYTLRAGAPEDDSPEKALRRLNAGLRADASTQFVTAVLAYARVADDGGIRARLALAGHPPAMLVYRGGTVEAVGEPGMMLGVVPDPELVETEVRLAAGDLLLIYTDGVTEAGPRSAPVGELGLAAILGGLADRDPNDVVAAVEAAVLAAQDGEPRDDIAVLAIAPVSK